MRPPSIRDLPEDLRAATSSVASTLSEHGARGWLVGGAVRDLALGRRPSDADLATSAHPEEVARWFRRTSAVGRAFGTMLVHDAGVEVQVTTFRAERDYADGRHPDEVVYAETLEEDSLRRDFTCNALYLDPLTDELRDPRGGMADLGAGVLRCVGIARERFAEDGLRLLRLARFSAELHLVVQPETLAAAARALDALRGVSVERVFEELRRIAGGAGPGRGFALLDDLGVLPRLLPGWRDAREERRARVERLAELPEVGRQAWLAALVNARAEELAALRAPKALIARVEAIGSMLERMAQTDSGSDGRAEAIRLVRAEAWGDAAALARAGGGAAAIRAAELVAFAASLSPGELHPEPLLNGADLREAGLPPGPRFGELLLALETEQLEGRVTTRAQALEWLRAR